MFATASATSLSKSLGYSRQKTFDFRKAKEESLNKKQRFKKRVTNPLVEDNKAITSQTLLGNSSGETVIELGGIGAGALPPAWVDIYDEVQEKVKKIRDIHRDVQKLMANRIKMQFGNHEDLDAQIEKRNDQATNLLQDCEEHMRSISRMGAPDETITQTKIRKNIERVLATQIQEVALVLRKQQKGFLDKVKDQSATGTLGEFNMETTDELDDENLQEAMMVEDLARERDEDINKLVDNINKLNQLFKDMNQIVIEQGTIVDRIDYNLEKAVDSTSRGKKELVKAKQSMDNKCGSYCIRILILLNVIFSVLLVFKFAHR